MTGALQVGQLIMYYNSSHDKLAQLHWRHWRLTDRTQRTIMGGREVGMFGGKMGGERGGGEVGRGTEIS